MQVCSSYYASGCSSAYVYDHNVGFTNYCFRIYSSPPPPPPSSNLLQDGSFESGQAKCTSYQLQYGVCWSTGLSTVWTAYGGYNPVRLRLPAVAAGTRNPLSYYWL